MQVTHKIKKRLHGLEIAYTHARNTEKDTRFRGFGISPAASHPIPPQDCSHLAIAPKGISSTTPYSQSFQASLDNEVKS